MPNTHAVAGTIIPLLFALAAGAATAMQPGVNARFAELSGHRLHGGVINFAVGLATMLVVWAIGSRTVGAGLPDTGRIAGGPWWMWMGGVLGAFFVTTAVFVTPLVGAANYLAAMIAGQLLAAMVIDHFGLLGLPVMSISPGRLAGLGLILAGMACVRWG